jgi:mitotic spindle assembly checkpoint protein MAD2
MSKSSTSTSTNITLRGSTEIVTEFFHYSVNNILYQRGVYPPESFKRMKNYDLPMMITTDEALQVFLSNILKQLDGELRAYSLKLH